MLSPIEFLMEHRKLILEQYRENDSKAKKAWERLQKMLPQLSGAMSFNTFKQYISVFVIITDGLDKVIQNRDEVIGKLKIEKANLNRRLKEATQRLDKVIQTKSIEASVIQRFDKNPKRISGWNVQKSKDGYYRCYRKIAKRLHCVYIGKDLDLEKARIRIIEKEKTLGL
jgi:hypothetical protein